MRKDVSLRRRGKDRKPDAPPHCRKDTITLEAIKGKRTINEIAAH